MEREESAGELDDHEVNHDDEHPDDEEGGVGKEAVAQVFLVVDLSGGKHVHDLEPDEQIEDESHVTRRVAVDTWKVDDCLVKFITVDLVESAWEDEITLILANDLSVSIESEFFLRFRDHVLASEQENEEDYHLEEGHIKDVLGHLAGNNEVVFVLRRSFEQVRARQLSSKGQRSQRIHDHVDPKELNGLQG